MSSAASRIPKGFGLFAIFVVLNLGLIKVFLGGGEAFPDPTGGPLVSDVEVAATLDFPPGCVTVAESGRVFFDTHPFAAPGRFGEPHVFELVDGEPIPWPIADQSELFVAPFGITADKQGRLWVTEPATLDRDNTRILGFDIETGEKLHEFVLPDGELLFAQDLRVSPDGRFIVLADTGILTLMPGQLALLEIETGRLVRTFQHETLNPQDWYIERFDGEPHRIGWGLITFKVGVDGITFGPKGEWLYYGTMSHNTLYRLPSALFLDPSTTAEALAAAIEVVGKKPQTDGIAATADGRILLTDIEHGGIVEIGDGGSLRTLTKSEEVIWADSIEVDGQGNAWFTDSAIPAYLQQTLAPPSREVLAAAAPYRLYKFAIPEP